MERSGRAAATVWAVVVVLLLSAALRFHALERQSLWVDELSTWWTSRTDTLVDLIRNLPGPWPPAHFLVVRVMQHVAGESEFSMRFPSALAGSLAVAAMYTLGRRIYSHREGLLGAALMAVMWMPINYSQELRAYSMLVLFSTLATYFWVVLIQTIGKTRTVPARIVAGYVVTGSLCAYTHYFGVVLIALQGLAAGLYAIRQREIRTVLLVYGLTALAYLPWLPVLWAQYTAPLSSPSWEQQVNSLPDVAVNFLWFTGYVFNKSQVVMVVAGGILGLYMFQQLANYVRSKSVRGWLAFLRTPDALLLFWWVGPFVFVYVVSYFFEKSLVVARYFLISLPAAYLLLARAILGLAARLRWRSLGALAGVGAVALLLGHLVFGLGYYRIPRSAQIREAVAFVLEHDPATVEDSVITALAFYSAPTTSTRYLSYYFERAQAVRRVDLSGGRAADVATLEERVRAENPRYIWFILTHLQPDEEFMAFLDAHYTLVEQRDFHKTAVWLYENTPPGGVATVPGTSGGR
jgi:hypothetical protein